MDFIQWDDYGCFRYSGVRDDGGNGSIVYRVGITFIPQRKQLGNKKMGRGFPSHFLLCTLCVRAYQSVKVGVWRLTKHPLFLLELTRSQS